MLVNHRLLTVKQSEAQLIRILNLSVSQAVRGQYGHVKVRISPAEENAGFVFENKIVGGAIPREYIEPARKGMEEALEGGIMAGFPMIDVKVELYDGSYHEVDSSEMAFKIAGSMAIKDGCKKQDLVF